MNMKKKKTKLPKVTNKTVWENNHTVIKEAFVRLYEELKRSPTQEEIAKRCSLSRKCVNEHLKELKLEDVTPSIKSETYEVLTGLTK